MTLSKMETETMQVWPTSETVRKLIRHPTGGAFRDTGPSEWPDDSFTHRRRMDGDITLEDPGEKKDVSEKKADLPALAVESNKGAK
jgi:hypothetical protein